MMSIERLRQKREVDTPFASVTQWQRDRLLTGKVQVRVLPEACPAGIGGSVASDVSAV